MYILNIENFWSTYIAKFYRWIHFLVIYHNSEKYSHHALLKAIFSTSLKYAYVGL